MFRPNIINSVLSCLLLLLDTPITLSFVFHRSIIRADVGARASNVVKDSGLSLTQFHSLQGPMGNGEHEEFAELIVIDSSIMNRRSMISSVVSATAMIATNLDSQSFAEEVAATPSEDFESIAARAGRMSREVEALNPSTLSSTRATDKTIYDFSLPIQGELVPFGTIIRQEYTTEILESLGRKEINIPKVKAIVVVNIKQDDPVARKTIPELISLAAKYGRGESGSLAIVCSPTDQGYYEPDTSQLIRLKLASEYGYGINPSTILTDKVILLGTGSTPFWRWLQSTCRTPAGLGRVEGNFEKFLIDGRTGLPVRRYPRKYSALNMADDIEAIIAGKPLPPAKANFLEEWRTAAAEADRDTYRFEKGLNVFDQ
jgi:glutathione peroxidase-family protein